METVVRKQAWSPTFLAPRTRTIHFCVVAPLEQGHTPFLLLPPPPTIPTTVTQTSALATTHAGRLLAVFVRRRRPRNINNNINKPNLTDNCSHSISTTITSPAGVQAHAVDQRHTSPTLRCRGSTIHHLHLHNPKLSLSRRLQVRLSQPRQPRPTPAP